MGTDHVDLYWLHVWDDITPAEEVLQGMADLVRVDKVRYYGLCNTPAWFTVQVATLAHAHGLPAPVALQMEYSLVSRDIEREHVRAARELGLGIVPWSPLAGGFLNGKYNRDQSPAADAGRLAQASTPSSSAHARPTSWRRTWPRPDHGLPDDAASRLDAISAPELGNPYGIFTRQMIASIVGGGRPTRRLRP